MYKVLLAEDEAVMRTAFRKMMDWNKSICTLCAVVSNGAEALQYIAANPVDIVVTDLKMPVMDGLELIERLKEADFAGIIFVMSNYTDFELVRTALTSGATDYMLKLNLDGNSLSKQLDKAVRLLSATKTVEDRKNYLPSVSDAMAEYFSASKEAAGLPSLLKKLFELHDSIIPCYFAVKNPDVPANTKTSPAGRVLMVLEQIFAEMGANITAVSDTEILLLVPCDQYADCTSRLEDKLYQAVREVRAYLSLNANVLISPKSKAPHQARQYYAECKKLSAAFNDSSKIFVKYLDEIIFSRLPKFDKNKRYKKEVRDALMYIHLNFSEKISLDDVAGAVNLNSSYLCRLFKQETGGPMFRYINDLRMQKAAELIKQGNTYMREVAAAVGIEDQFFFARVFKKHFGMPPSEYGKAGKRA